MKNLNNTEEIKKQFITICSNMLVYAYETNDDTYTGFDGYIPFARKLIELIDSNNEKKYQFIELFKELWENNKIDHDLIAICMHRLRWQELKEYFEKCHSSAIMEQDWRAEPCINDILDSFDDNCEDAQDMYLELFNP